MKTTENEIVVARVGEKQLMLSDVSKIIPDNLEMEDSTKLAQEYLQKWVRQELLLKKANENLSPEQKDLSVEMEEYRNSIIIYKYKNALLNEQMDTLVTKNQVEQYYNTNIENFRLNKNIVKGIFIKTPLNAANPTTLKEKAEDLSDEGMNNLRQYCLQYARSFDFFTDKWVDFAIVKNNIPENIEDEEKFLTRNSLVEFRDAENYYLVNLLDFKLVGELAPLEYETENIRNLILNKRKVDFLKQIEDNVYKEGVRQNKFKILNRKS